VFLFLIVLGLVLTIMFALVLTPHAPCFMLHAHPQIHRYPPVTPLPTRAG
jgi:hypothetical protein